MVSFGVLLSGSQASFRGFEDGLRSKLGVRWRQFGALWGGDGKLSHARNCPSWSGAVPGAHRQGPLISERLLWGNRYGWWDSRDGDVAVGKSQISAQLEEEVRLFCPRKGRA